MAGMFRLTPVFAIAVAGVLSTTMAYAANTAPAIDAFNATFASVNDYTYKVHSHEILGSSVQDRVYDYSFMKPNFAKIYIEAGSDQGSGAVWAGGNAVSWHPSLRGYTISDGLLQNIVDAYANTPGTLSQTDGGTVMGVATDRLELHVATPAKDGDVTEQVLYLDKSTHFPIRQFFYQGDSVVLDQTIYDLKLNPGLTQSDFPL